MNTFRLGSSLKSDEERSKFLGGDEEHTHLVKGLDYALLARERDAIKKQQRRQQEEATGRHESSTTAGSVGTEAHRMAERVVSVVCQREEEGTVLGDESAANPFVKGRVVYKFDFGVSDLPSMVVVARNDVADAGTRREERAVLGFITKKVAAVYQQRQRLIEHEQQRKQEGAAAAAAAAKKDDQHHDNLEEEKEEIFPGARWTAGEQSTSAAAPTKRDYFAVEDGATRHKDGSHKKSETTTEELVKELEKENADEDEQVARLRAEVERLKEEQRRAEQEQQEDEQRRLMDSDSKEMDPAMRKYFAVCGNQRTSRAHGRRRNSNFGVVVWCVLGPTEKHGGGATPSAAEARKTRQKRGAAGPG